MPPEAPSEGRISLGGRGFPKNRLEVEVAVAVDVEDSFAISRGKWIRAATMWETRPENNPAEMKTARRWYLGDDSCIPSSFRACRCDRKCPAAEPKLVSAMVLNARCTKDE